MGVNGGFWAVQRFWTWAGLVDNPKKKKNQTRAVFGNRQQKPGKKRTISLPSSSGAGTREEKDVVSSW